MVSPSLHLGSFLVMWMSFVLTLRAS
ncbi:hypothetical protein LINPERHAP2_LOCUS37066 [Linum perenne]